MAAKGETYLYQCAFSGLPMAATITRDSDTVWIRITRNDKFVSHYGYPRGSARAAAVLAEIKRKGIR